MLIKYLPFGTFWNKKYDKDSVFNKFITALNDTFFYYSTKIDENYKVYDFDKISQWNEHLKLPDDIFYFDNVYFYEKFKIKINRKYDTLEYATKCLESIGITIQVLKNSENEFICGLIGYPNPNPFPILPLTLPAPLNGGKAGFTEAYRITTNFLDRILPITTKLEVVID